MPSVSEAICTLSLGGRAIVTLVAIIPNLNSKRSPFCPSICISAHPLLLTSPSHNTPFIPKLDNRRTTLEIDRRLLHQRVKSPSRVICISANVTRIVPVATRSDAEGVDSGSSRCCRSLGRRRSQSRREMNGSGPGGGSPS